MKLFVITLFATAFLSVQGAAKPGGYTLKGGVDHRMMHDKPAGYYSSAQSAGRFAQQHRLEEDLQATGGFGTINSKRSVAPQQVTFFTSHANHAALTSLAQGNAQEQQQQFHTKREVYEKPLYYNEYHNRR